MSKGSATKAAAEQVSMKTLKPVYKINFKFSASGNSMDNTLAFDQHGRAWTYVKSGGGNVPAGAYKIYRGSISRKGVHFDLMKSAIRYSAGSIPQGMGYNPKNGRIYFISDDSIISAPTSKIDGSLKPSDVHYIRANSNREFEGLDFNSKGEGFLLTLRPVELMKMSGSF